MMSQDASPPDVVAVQELKAYLRIDGETEDFLLHDLLRSATSTVEQWLGQLLISRDVEERAPIWGQTVRLAMAPVHSVLAVAIAATDGSFQALDPGEWMMVRLPGDVTCIRLAGHTDNISEVRYRAGLADDWNGVPEPIRLAVLRTAAHFHGSRDDPAAPQMPVVIRQLLEPFRIRHIA
jgi:uncharacterized phiE125 gp8 family phage protein